jgi:hypothetical protein
MHWVQQGIGWLSGPIFEPWAIPFAFVCYFIVFRYWHGLSPVADVGDSLSDVDGNTTKGFARKWLSRVRRMLKHAKTVRGVALACISRLLLRLGLGTALALVVGFITSIALQPYLGPFSSSATERIEQTALMLGAGLLDALTFDLFSIWGIELRPHFDELTPRILMLVFYAMEAVLIGDTIFTLGMNAWTGLVCVLFPQSAIRLSKSGSPEGKRQLFIHTFTAIGST